MLPRRGLSHAVPPMFAATCRAPLAPPQLADDSACAVRLLEWAGCAGPPCSQPRWYSLPWHWWPCPTLARRRSRSFPCPPSVSTRGLLHVGAKRMVAKQAEHPARGLYCQAACADTMCAADSRHSMRVRAPELRGADAAATRLTNLDLPSHPCAVAGRQDHVQPLLGARNLPRHQVC